MGCDIHALMERKRYWGFERTDGTKSFRWLDSGDPDIDRHYGLFALLAGVRNSFDVTPISEPRGIPGIPNWSGNWEHGEPLPTNGDYESVDFDEQPCQQFLLMAERYGVDGHSHSWVTLDELTARIGDAPYPAVASSFDALVRAMTTAGAQRLVFFFDN